MTKYQVTRDVTSEECHWLHRTVKQGEIVQRFVGCTYGCIGDGIAVTDGDNQPFFEMPRSALSELGDR